VSEAVPGLGATPMAAAPMAAAPLAAAPLAAADFSGAAATRFRIFKRGGWRKAFRLEDVFWETLDQAAAGEGVKLADYVKRLTDTLGPDVNVSSQMRVRAVEWLAQRCRALADGQSTDRLMGSVLAAPVPCFVISAGRELVRSNAEFQAYLGKRARESGGAPAAGVTMALDAPVARIVALLSAQEGRALACGFIIRSGAATMNGRARVTLLPPGRDLLVGYVLEDGQA
jgi:predicted DNA-binding ribbon-helix-helix protein